MTETTTAERRPQARDAAHEVQATTPDHATVPASTEPPTIPAARVSRPDRDGNRTVTIRCPFGCGRIHVHGLPAGESTVGHRSGHCTADASHVGYVITTRDAL